MDLTPTCYLVLPSPATAGTIPVGTGILTEPSSLSSKGEQTSRWYNKIFSITNGAMIRHRSLAFRCGFFCWAVITLLAQSSPLRAELPSTDRRGFSPLIQRTSPAVVCVIASGPSKGDGETQPGRVDGNEAQPRETLSDGSGVILTPDGYIVTNYHVIKGAANVTVERGDLGKEYRAKVVGYDSQIDIAVLKINESNLPTLQFAEPGTYHVGDIVLAIGNPLSFANSVSQGVISAVGRSINNAAVEDYVQTDAAINPGNSGGALIDVDGRLVGINSLFVPVVGQKVNTGLGFAIAAALVKSVYEEIKATGRVDRAYAGMGLQDLNAGLAAMLSLPEKTSGVLVTEVAPNSPAQKAGVQRKDVIQKVNGETVVSATQLRELITFSKPDTDINITALRGTSLINERVHLTRMPEPEATIAGQNENILIAGLHFSDLTPQNRQQFHIPRRVQGGLVTDVVANSGAQQLGFQAGMVFCQVNDLTVTSAQQTVDALKDFTKGIIYLYTSAGYIYAPIDLTR
jgi:serine protease Do